MNPELTLEALFPFRVFFGLLSVAWGACIGSFLNVCVFRIPNDLSVVKPRSFCPRCGTKIAWYHNLPLVSFWALGRRCWACGGRISIRYVLIETLVAVLFLLAWFKYNLLATPRPLHLVPVYDWKLVPVYWLFVSGLVLGTFTDFEHLIIPDRVTWGGIAAGLILSVAVPALHGTASPVEALGRSALGAVVGFGLLWGVATLGRIVFRKEAMGFGDVKLLGAIGAFLGWRAVLMVVMVSSLAGSIAGLAMIFTRRRELQSRIPYGPYLALAAILWLFWGQTLWSAYLQLITGHAVPEL